MRQSSFEFNRGSTTVFSKMTSQSTLDFMGPTKSIAEGVEEEDDLMTNIFDDLIPK